MRKRRPSSSIAIQLVIALLLLAGCASRGPAPLREEPIPPIPPNTWREIKEEIWTASALAQSESEELARKAMNEWMARVREKTESEFIPWYTAYWTQQWIGLKAGWYGMNKEDDEAAVEDYLVEYFLQRYDELVLQPAGSESDPQSISEQAAARYVRLLSQQLRRMPKVHSVSARSLKKASQRVPLIRPSGEPAGDTVPLAVLFERDALNGVTAYDALLGVDGSGEDRVNASLHDDRLQEVTEGTVARLIAEMPVRAGGSTAAVIIGETAGLFISAGIAAWSVISHDRDKPKIESQLRESLEAGLEQMWQVLMEDPELGVMYPVNRMSQDLENALFVAYEPQPMVSF